MFLLPFVHFDICVFPPVFFLSTFLHCCLFAVILLLGQVAYLLSILRTLNFDYAIPDPGTVGAVISQVLFLVWRAPSAWTLITQVSTLVWRAP